MDDARTKRAYLMLDQTLLGEAATILGTDDVDETVKLALEAVIRDREAIRERIAYKRAHPSDED